MKDAAPDYYTIDLTGYMTRLAIRVGDPESAAYWARWLGRLGAREVDRGIKVRGTLWRARVRRWWRLVRFLAGGRRGERSGPLW